MAKDPVCGMNVSERSAMYMSEFLDNTYYFCSETCKTAFNKDPVKYTGTGEHSGHSMHHCCC